MLEGEMTNAALPELTYPCLGWQCRLNYNQKIKINRHFGKNIKNQSSALIKSYFQIQTNALYAHEKEGSYQWVDIS
jgi:hypothetical protein